LCQGKAKKGGAHTGIQKEPTIFPFLFSDETSTNKSSHGRQKAVKKERKKYMLGEGGGGKNGCTPSA